jgi:hypothetical protein
LRSRTGRFSAPVDCKSLRAEAAAMNLYRTGVPCTVGPLRREDEFAGARASQTPANCIRRSALSGSAMLITAKIALAPAAERRQDCVAFRHFLPEYYSPAPGFILSRYAPSRPALRRHRLPALATARTVHRVEKLTLSLYQGFIACNVVHHIEMEHFPNWRFWRGDTTRPVAWHHRGDRITA